MESGLPRDLQTVAVRANACLSTLGTRRNVVTIGVPDSCFTGCSVRRAPNSIIAGNRRSEPLLLRIYADLALHRVGLELRWKEVEGLACCRPADSLHLVLSLPTGHTSILRRGKVLGLASDISWNLINRGVVSQREASLVESTK